MQNRNRESRCPVLIALFACLVASGTSDAHMQGNGPVVQNEPRAMARVVFFGNTGVAGEYAIEYGKPAWKSEYDQDFAKLTHGKRLRLGKDWWTTLNTYCALTFDKVEIKAGEYFLALDCSEKGDWSLIALDPEPLRKSKMDAFSTSSTKGGSRIPMVYEVTKDEVKELSIQFLADEKKPRDQTLEIRFGKHRLTAAFQPKV